jgi:hypothetical protein
MIFLFQAAPIGAPLSLETTIIHIKNWSLENEGDSEMQEFVELTRLVGGMPFWMVVALVVLGGFALAAYAIHAVLAVTKDRN